MAAPRTIQDLRALPPRSQMAYERVLEALALARYDNLTIRTAAGQAGVSVSTVRRYAGDAIERDAFGRLVAKDADRLLRLMHVTTPEGGLLLPVRGSRVASAVAQHANAIRRFLSTGDMSGLARFEGKRIAGHALETDPDRLERMALQGEIDWLSIYERQAG